MFAYANGEFFTIAVLSIGLAFTGFTSYTVVYNDVIHDCPPV